MINTNMSYFRRKIKELRSEYTEKDKKEFIKSKGGKCELCSRKDKDIGVFGPSHYIKRRISFRVNIHVHKVMFNEEVHKVCICDLCHLNYHLWNRLEPDAVFGDKTIEEVAKTKRFTYGNPISLAVRKKAMKKGR